MSQMPLARHGAPRGRAGMHDLLVTVGGGENGRPDSGQHFEADDFRENRLGLLPGLTSYRFGQPALS
jgi:hypothetical protein